MADYRRKGAVAIIALNNPPVNALSHHVRVRITNGIKKAEKDNGVSAVVICGQGDVFSAGGDIKEFSTGQYFQGLVRVEVHTPGFANSDTLSLANGQELCIATLDGNILPRYGYCNAPGLTEVVHTIEACSKPVVAAISGLAFGGGLEISLGCHYRMASSNSRVAFPELMIGLLPAATGTQRLPRVAGIANTIDVIVSGRHVPATEAHQMGILDKITDGDVVKDAIAFAHSVAKEPVGPRRVSKMPVKDAENADWIFDEARKRVMKRSRGAISRMSCVRVIEAAAKTSSYTEGVTIERKLALELMTSAQFSAMQYAFFAERTAQKWELPGGKISHKTVQPLPVKTAAVIGCGTMGNGIAMSFVDNNIPIFLLEINQKLLEKGMHRIRHVYESSVRKGRISEETARQRISLITPTLDYNQIRNVDVVVEVVFETMSIKKEVFKKLDSICKPGTVLCSNTSILDIDEIASATRRPDKVIGTHFFVPAHAMKLLETVRGKLTSPETIATAMTLGKTLKKIPVLVGNCQAFVANRMMNCRSNESLFLLEEGCLPEEIDNVLEDFGFIYGPFKVFDMVGGDALWRVRQEMGLVGKNVPKNVPVRYRHGSRFCAIADILFERGLFGQKTGKGYYKYEKPGAYEPMINPEIEKLITEYRREHGIERRKIPYQEILERCVYCVINEGFRVLEDGIATRMEDIDTIWIYGYGWPRHLGGPMYYARKMVGLPRLYERICYYQSKHPDIMHWQPSDLLKKMAAKEASKPSSNL